MLPPIELGYFWFSFDISDVFERQRRALFWLSPDAVNDVYMVEAPASLFCTV